MDIQLTSHFRLSEFTRSTTATTRGIPNIPTIEAISNLQQLCLHVLEPLRAFAGCPIAITSGYRSSALNQAVGGSKTSQHMTGEAADIRIPDEQTGRRWFEWLRTNVPYHQLIWEKDTPQSTHHWIHIAYRQYGPNKMQVIDDLVKHPN